MYVRIYVLQHVQCFRYAYTRCCCSGRCMYMYIYLKRVNIYACIYTYICSTRCSTYSALGIYIRAAAAAGAACIRIYIPSHYVYMLKRGAPPRVTKPVVLQKRTTKACQCPHSSNR